MFDKIPLEVSGKWVRKQVKMCNLHLVSTPYECDMQGLFSNNERPSFYVVSQYGVDYRGWLFGNIAIVRANRGLPKDTPMLPLDVAKKWDTAAKKLRESWHFDYRAYCTAYDLLLREVENYLYKFIEGEA